MNNKEFFEELHGHKVQIVMSNSQYSRYIGVLSRVVDDTWIKLIPFIPSDELKQKAKEVNEAMEIIPTKWPVYKRIDTIDSIILLDKPDSTYDRKEED